MMDKVLILLCSFLPTTVATFLQWNYVEQYIISKGFLGSLITRHGIL